MRGIDGGQRPGFVRRTLGCVCGLVLVPLALNCGPQDSPGSATTVVDSSGIAIVTSIAPAWGTQPPRIDSMPVVSIGADVPGPYQFSTVFRGLLLEGGSFVVVEGTASEIRVFDADGKHVRTMGRQGVGPGEFRFIATLLRYPGDSLLAYDQSQRRTTIFPLAGGEPRIVRTQVPGNLVPFGTFGDGRVVMYNPGQYRRDLSIGLQWDTTDVVLLDPADGSGRTLLRLPSRQLYFEPGNSRQLTPAHHSVHATTANGFYWAMSDRFEIFYFDRDGMLRRTLRRPVEPMAVTPAMFDRWMEVNLEEVRRTEGAPAIERYRPDLERAWRGEQVPFFDAAFVDGNERLWLGSAIWPEIYGAQRRWSVFDAQGAWLGDLDAPRDLLILDCRDDLVLGVLQPAGEAPMVQVHRLLPR